MAFFIRDMGPNHRDEVWRIDENEAVDIFASAPESGIARQFKAGPGETALERMAKETPWFEKGNTFRPLRVAPGEHNPRIARPLYGAHGDWGDWSPSLHTEPEVVAASRGQARTLLRLLERICQTVQPGPNTFAVFGHDIRNLLILASTEVEAHWRGILVANGAQRRRFSTNDYVLLAEVLGLRDFAVRFPAFPALEPIRPFEGWGLGDNPTNDLPWYAAYNAVKHNREEEFGQASLKNAFTALSACAVLLSAQYGRGGLGRQTDLSAFFHFVERPNWPICETYVPWPRQGSGTSTHEHFTVAYHPNLAAVQDKQKVDGAGLGVRRRAGRDQHL